MTDRIDRRHALGVIGAAGFGALLAACSGDDTSDASPTSLSSTAPTDTSRPETSSPAATDPLDAAGSCTLAPELTEGPFFVDDGLMRGDIREDRDGTELRLELRVREAEGCAPLSGAVVDLWHCDAEGNYSGFGAAGAETRFLRGAQITDEQGTARFVTVYPGWYPGRTVHIHAKVYFGDATALTTQLFFDDATTDAVFATAPYSGRRARDVRNDGDSIFADDLILTVESAGDAYVGRLNLDVVAA